MAETYSELLEDDPEYGEYWLQIVSHLSDFELASLDGTLESLMQSAIAKIFPAVAPQERAFIWRMAVMTLINRLPEALERRLPEIEPDSLSVQMTRLTLVIEFVANGIEAAMLAASP